MHSAVRQQDEQFAHDPYVAANDNIAETQNGAATAMPSDKILAYLYTEGHIGQDERDAGEHTIKLASIVRSPLKSAVVRYTVRDADRKWRQVEEQRHAVRPKLDALISSVRYEPRRKAFTQAFVVEESNIDLSNPHRAAQGLADAARHLWGTPANAAPITVADNDNEPEVEVEPIRVHDNFDRLKARGQLDKDPETNETLHAAGLRFAQDHYMAGLRPLGAIDYSREVVDCGGQQIMAESMMKARDRYRSARQLLGEHYGKVVEAVVVDGRTLGDIGLAATHYKDVGKAQAAASERLNAGLRLLAISYGIMRK